MVRTIPGRNHEIKRRAFNRRGGSARVRPMNRTPLFEQHRRAGGRLVEFAGWEMPIQYGGVIEEYQTVRTAVGFFDVSHMGRVAGGSRDSLVFLHRASSNNVAKLAGAEAHSSMVCTTARGLKAETSLLPL